jgi:hypothetical protein
VRYLTSLFSDGLEMGHACLTHSKDLVPAYGLQLQVAGLSGGHLLVIGKVLVVRDRVAI